MCNMGSLFIAYLEESEAENTQQWEIQESSVSLHYFTCRLHSDTLNMKIKSTHDFQD